MEVGGRGEGGGSMGWGDDVRVRQSVNLWVVGGGGRGLVGGE